MTIGIDEVGRGCWAGPLVAGAALLREPIDGLTDSKLLSARKREELDVTIRKTDAYGLGWVTPREVDELGLTAAVALAMRRALDELRRMSPEANDADIIIDGNQNFLPDEPRAVTKIKADLTEPSVSAASILAKVARDRYMVEASTKFPGYGFEKHVGYGTAAHIAALQELGVCELHRLSYKPIRKLVEH